MEEGQLFSKVNSCAANNDVETYPIKPHVLTQCTVSKHVVANSSELTGSEVD